MATTKSPPYIMVYHGTEEKICHHSFFIMTLMAIQIGFGVKYDSNLTILWDSLVHSIHRNYSRICLYFYAKAFYLMHIWTWIMGRERGIGIRHGWETTDQMTSPVAAACQQGPWKMWALAREDLKSPDLQSRPDPVNTPAPAGAGELPSHLLSSEHPTRETR